MRFKERVSFPFSAIGWNDEGKTGNIAHAGMWHKLNDGCTKGEE